MNVLARVLGLTALALLASCGGGGGDSSTPPIAGIEGTGVARGPVTGFGSVFVNGVEYLTNASTTFTVDGAPATERDLKVGQVVELRARIPQSGGPTATSIVYEAELKGTISAVDAGAATFVVLGQTVLTDGGTSFDNSVGGDFDGLSAGLSVEVSGYRDDQGRVVATRVEAEPAANPDEVKGTVAGLDTTLRRFTIGALVVDYSTAALSNFPSGAPANGDLVEAQGTLGGGNMLVATRLERKRADIGGSNGDRATIEGFISVFNSATDFTVNGQRVTTTTGTTYQNGTTANLALGARVQVEGQLNAAGVLAASKVEFKAGTSTRAVATVGSINVAGNNFTVLGVTVQVGPATRYEDKSSAQARPFNLTLLRTGDWVEVRGSEQGTTLVASLVERDNPDTRVELRGTAGSLNPAGGSLVILGVTVTAAPGARYYDVTGAEVTQAQFFAQANARLVSVRGTTPGAGVSADRFEIES